MDFLKSVSKIVLLLMAITACLTFASGVLSENHFMILAIAVFTFYFKLPDRGNTTPLNGGN